MNWLQRKYWHYKLTGSPYQSLFCAPDSREFVSLDCETTSLDPKRAELVTIAATRIIDNRILTSQPFEALAARAAIARLGFSENPQNSPSGSGRWH